ncbi:MAG: hypothetical protein M3P18_16940 [Actinomycetota bacterium]|nr:hypothetical protein [Actinomycetota bacterium]
MCVVGVGYWRYMRTRKYGRRELALRFAVGIVWVPVCIYRFGWPWWILPLWVAVFAVATWWAWKRGRVASP